ncbi:MAG TPA: hypothetical protein V6C65_37460, partial [Allocoleopsis sp.]
HLHYGGYLARGWRFDGAVNGIHYARQPIDVVKMAIANLHPSQQPRFAWHTALQLDSPQS